ncbi:MAG: NADH-quinone oxidoreductase subunit NuoB [Pedobacter sp.]
MIRAIVSRIKQGYRTMPYPAKPLQMPERFRGYPVVSTLTRTAEQVDETANCAYGAFTTESGGCLDMGKCLFCAECSAGAIEFTTDYQLAVTSREHLMVHPGSERHHARQLAPDLLRMFGRSLKFREVSAGGCNACEADTNVLSTIGWDLGRFGIQFVASPRHADGLWVTGPVTQNMVKALITTYEAIPAPKIVVACGACAINGGPYIDFPNVNNGAGSLIPVDLYIPGCPPHPATILDGLLRILDKIR